MSDQKPDSTQVKHTISDGLVFMSYIGEVTVDHIIQSRTAILADPDFEPGMSFLVDLTEASLASVDSAEMRRLGAHGRKVTEGWGAHRTAVVTSRSLEFGMIRQYEVVGERPGLTLRVFRDHDAALSWLQEDGPTAG